jgi:hypothetical protein
MLCNRICKAYRLFNPCRNLVSVIFKLIQKLIVFPDMLIAEGEIITCFYSLSYFVVKSFPASGGNIKTFTSLKEKVKFN